ncbi:YggS family pyridoxal phosphate-dependent enzyme [Campylobacter blaseri]|uniref:Pyridoxal phosphate homeostasis protein n=1 Tax=Campylobacter blaseri TaxID=2042961 RepID=A0A2P8R2S5_9BACT|nr:YggS family pyridoxal phosphate-dependent enzyme [Campylobacter blaseri]PSM52790.1 YggS family pyridoxal phosphate-dependent enzyme [Campylobacter blaseri]PSM54438.1 YggS family pyridoxal phosphate-dependent enzyme [Campylobacter blaseri]
MVNLKNLLENIDEISNQEKVKLVAVSKNVTEKEVIELYNQGQIDFGENRVQELKRKQDILSSYPLKWHFIGTLQKNKINHMLTTKPVLWQSCSSLELAYEVDKRAKFSLNTLLQINTALEDTKSGVEPNLAIETYLQIKEECKNLNLQGIMCIGANSDDKIKVAKTFEDTYKIYQNLQKYGVKICSMGMSGDYEIAIKSGSNMIRLGSMLYR